MWVSTHGFALSHAVTPLAKAPPSLVSTNPLLKAFSVKQTCALRQRGPAHPKAETFYDIMVGQRHPECGPAVRGGYPQISRPLTVEETMIPST